MDKKLLSAEIQEYITSNINADVSKLTQKKNKITIND